jgi:transposase InsO family protein
MKELHLIPRARKKFKVTTNSNHNKLTAPNLLEQNFIVSERNKVWVADITYIHIQEGWLYLAVVIDLFSRAIVGWAMGSRITAELVDKALRMAVKWRNPVKGLIFHSDKGTQYCNNLFKNTVSSFGIIQSTGGKGNCYDNAVAESFFHTLKVEQIHPFRFCTRKSAVQFLKTLKDEGVYLWDYKTFEGVKRKVSHFIEDVYNQKRLHFPLGYRSPSEYEKYEMENGKLKVSSTCSNLICI